MSQPTASPTEPVTAFDLVPWPDEQSLPTQKRRSVREKTFQEKAFSRSAFASTKTLERPIAAAANIGESSVPVAG